jgi:hypothetical protein
VRAYARKFIVGKPMIVGVLLPPEVKARLRLTEADLLPKPKS